MNWYKRAQIQDQFILWHATLPRSVETIIQQGAIKPANTVEEETGNSPRGWNIFLPSTDYGEVVYLHYNREGAIYYAFLRLRKEWQEIEDIRLLFDEEEWGFIGLFKIHVSDLSKVKKIDWGEYIYNGIIPNSPNKVIWFKGPEWIDRTEDLNKFVEREIKVLELQYGEEKVRQFLENRKK